MSFVKPNSIVQDPRAADEKARAIAEQTSKNLFHINAQLHEQGHSLETLLSAVAKQVWGVNIDPHAPKPKEG